MNSVDFKKDHEMLLFPEGFSPQYNIVVNSKQQLLDEASDRNVFSTNYFFWLDAGYGHGHDVFPKSSSWAPRNLMNNAENRDKITLMEVNKASYFSSLDQVYKRKVAPVINGGFCGGSRKAVKSFRILHEAVLKQFLDKNMMDDDQTLTLACYLAKPELFNMIHGADWYDLFKFVH